MEHVTVDSGAQQGGHEGSMVQLHLGSFRVTNLQRSRYCGRRSVGMRNYLQVFSEQASAVLSHRRLLRTTCPPRAVDDQPTATLTAAPPDEPPLQPCADATRLCR